MLETMKAKCVASCLHPIFSTHTILQRFSTLFFLFLQPRNSQKANDDDDDIDVASPTLSGWTKEKKWKCCQRGWNKSWGVWENMRENTVEKLNFGRREKLSFGRVAHPLSRQRWRKSRQFHIHSCAYLTTLRHWIFASEASFTSFTPKNLIRIFSSQFFFLLDGIL